MVFRNILSIRSISKARKMFLQTSSLDLVNPHRLFLWSVEKYHRQHHHKTFIDIFLQKFQTTITNGRFYSRCREMRWEYQLTIFRQYSGLNLRPFGMHHEYPFILVFTIDPVTFPEKFNWFFLFKFHNPTVVSSPLHEFTGSPKGMMKAMKTIISNI